MKLWYPYIKLWIKRWILKENISFNEKAFFENAVRHSRDNILKPLENLMTLRGLKILDIGCGYGGAIECLKKENQITGIELNKDRASFAKGYFKDAKNVQIVNTDIFKFDLKNNYYDLIIAADVFEHISDPYKLIELIYDSLKIGGYCYVCFTPYNGIWGSHTELYIPIPYVHKVLSNKVVTKIIKKLGDYNNVINASFVIDQFLSLNKLTVNQFKEKVFNSNLEIIKEWNQSCFKVIFEYYCILRKTIY